MTRKKLQEKIGPYLLEELLGVGGMGAVYRAWDERLERRVALKQIRPDKVQRKNARKRFLREARIAARLNHPVLMYVHDILEEENSDWIVMELVEGTHLSRLLAAGPLPLHRLLPLALDIVSGLSAAHAAGILHRDLKSENVIITASGGAKILDFGLAKPLEADGSDLSLTFEGGILGTPRAMSPEQARGQGVDQRSDLFSLGTLLYEMLTGRSPFEGPGPLETMHLICHEPHESVAAQAPEIPAELSLLVDRLLAKSPAERPASADEVRTTLESVASFLQATEQRAGTGTEGEPIHPLAETPKRFPRADNPREVRTGERRQLTVLYCELVADRKTPNALDPEVLYEVLPPFQALVSHTIEHYGGHLGDLQGHRLVLYFGYPRSYEDNARRAVLTALEIVAGSKHLADHLKDATNLSARAGIHTGPAVVMAGEPEYLALGGTLDLASALAERAAAGCVLVSDYSDHLTSPFFTREPVEPQRLPGCETPLPVYRIQTVRPPQDRLRQLATLPHPSGRDREIALLTDRLQVTRTGVGQVVLLSGAPGLGKTRLLGAFRAQLADEPPYTKWLVAQGLPEARPLPLRPIAGLLHQLLEIDPLTDLKEQRVQRKEALQRFDGVADVDSVLAPLLEPFLPRTHLQPEQRRALCDLVPELLLESTELHTEAQQATVLVFEDLQWMDATTLELVGRLIDTCEAAPMLLVLTGRPDFQPPWRHHSHLTHLYLNPLAPAHIETLIERLCGSARLARERREEILNLSQGVPFDAEELTREALGKEPLEDGELTVPARLKDPLTAALDRLGTARDLAQLAAIFTPVFSYQDLLALWTLDHATLDHELERLLAAEVLIADDLVDEFSSPQHFRFQRPLLRTLALESLLEKDRRQLVQRLTGRTEDTSLTP